MTTEAPAKPLYWYVIDERGLHLFLEEEALTEAEWRKGAPADEVALLDAHKREHGV